MDPDLEAAVRRFKAEGFTVVERVFGGAEMQALGELVSMLSAAETAAIAAAGTKIEPGRRGPTARTTVELTVAGQVAWQLNRPMYEYAERRGDVTSPSAFRAFALDPRLTRLASALFGGRPAMVFQDQAFIKPPDVGGPRSYHQDNWYFGLASSDDILTAWIALDDADADNGALRYLPGSHLEGIVKHTNQLVNVDETKLDLGREVVAPVRRGGVVVHHGAALHCSRENVSGNNRRACETRKYQPTIQPRRSPAPHPSHLPLCRCGAFRGGGREVLGRRGQCDLGLCLRPDSIVCASPAG